MLPFHSIHETGARVLAEYGSVEAFRDDEEPKDRAMSFYEYQPVIEGLDGLSGMLVHSPLYEYREERILNLLDIEDKTVNRAE